MLPAKGFRTLFVVVGALLFLATAWLFSNPLGAGPDEMSHYVKAAGLSVGQLVGAREPFPPSTTLQSRWYAQVTRAFSLPERLAPVPNACFGERPFTSAACAEHTSHSAPAGQYLSYHALYPPTSYLMPALFMRFASNGFQALWLGRLASSLVAWALIVLALFTLWRGTLSSLLGVMVALTPEVFFVTVVLSNSALEIAGGVCFTAALLRFVWGQRGGWLASTGLALGGIALGTSRPTGAVWLVVPLLPVLILLGRAGVRDLTRASGIREYLAAALVAAAAIFDIVWSLAVHAQPHTSPHAVIATIPASLADIPSTLQQAVGVFGWLNIGLPSFVYLLWFAVAIALWAGAFLLGSANERVALVVAVALTFAAIWVVNTLLIASSGTYGQGRYYLPIEVATPMLAGFVLVRRLDRRIALEAAAGVGLLVWSGLQLLAWWEDARRFAVGRVGRHLFFLGAKWSPFGSWWPWIALAVVGCGAIAIVSVTSFAAAARRAQSPSRAAAVAE